MNDSENALRTLAVIAMAGIGAAMAEKKISAAELASFLNLPLDVCIVLMETAHASVLVVSERLDSEPEKVPISSAPGTNTVN
jgi:hypothetical protein